MEGYRESTSSCLLVAPVTTKEALRQSETLARSSIHPTLERLGVDLTWAKKLTEPAKTAGSIFSEINDATFLIFEVSRSDPDVFFYLGYAQSLSKIIITLQLRSARKITQLTRKVDYHIEYDLLAGWT